MVTPWKVEGLVVQPPGGIYMHSAYSVLVVKFPVHQGRNECRPAATGRVVKVLPYQVAAVTQSVRVLWAFGIQEDPRRAAGRCRQHHHTAL